MKLWIECARKLKVAMDEKEVAGNEENRVRITEIVGEIFPAFQQKETATIVQMVIGGMECADINPNLTLCTVVDGARTPVSVDEFHQAVGDCPTIKSSGGMGHVDIGTTQYSILLESGFELQIQAAVNDKGEPYLELKPTKGAHILID